MTEIKPWDQRKRNPASSWTEQSLMLEEIEELRAELAKSQPVEPPFPEADLTGVHVCCGDYFKCGRPCTPRGRALALRELESVEQGEPVEVQGRPAENFSFMVVDPKDADDLIKCGWEIRKLFTHPVRTMSDEPRYTVDQIADAACHAEVNDSKFESMCVYLGGIKGATA
mgnify:FL=1